MICFAIAARRADLPIQGEIMTGVSRRGFFGLAVSGAALASGTRMLEANAATSSTELTSLTRGAQPISTQEHGARLSKVQQLMQRQK